MNEKNTLTIDEIKELAEFAGLTVSDITDGDRGERFTIETAPEKGVLDEETREILHPSHIAYIFEYPEEGVYPLGLKD